MSYTETISEERDIRELGGIAEAEVNPYRIVTGGTDPNHIKQSTNPATEYPVGISRDAGLNQSTTYAADKPINFAHEGIAYCKMSGAGSRFQRVMATTAGAGIAHTSQDNCWTVGVAMKAWSDGDVIAVKIQQQFHGETVGS